MTFDTLGLKPALLRALKDLGFDQPTPIQTEAIPLVLQGRDLLAAAETGTGKTAAFGLPLLQHLADVPPPSGKRLPRALILAPTRELAAQVLASIKDYGRHVRLYSTAIFGGVGMGNQIRALQRGVDIIVATPGRLIDHMERGNVDLSAVQTLVLDEADRMLDMGFRPALERILGALPTKRQTLLFSATFAPEIRRLAERYLQQPEMVQIARPNAVAQTVQHVVHPVPAKSKRALLLELMSADSRRQTLVFGRTKHGCNKLCKFLVQHGFRAAAIHGNKSQNQRTQALADFRSGKITVLVATDIAARGLDIPQLPCVINHDLPQVAEDYVHRIGRTGRAGAEGLAISLVSLEEEELLQAIAGILDKELSIEPVPGFEPEWQFDLTPARRSAGPARRGRGSRNQGRGKGAGSGRNRNQSRNQNRSRGRSRGEGGGSQASSRSRDRQAA